MDFFQTVKKVGVFIVCAQMILHFKPAESYGKYIRLLIGMMVLAQLLAPTLALVKSVGADALRMDAYLWERELESNLQEVKKTCDMAEEMRNHITMEEIKTRINNENKEDDTLVEEQDTPAEGAGEILVDRIEVRIGE